MIIMMRWIAWLTFLHKAAGLGEGNQFVTKISKENTIQDPQGRLYDLKVLQPDASLFDPRFYSYDNIHAKEVVSRLTGKRFSVAVHRGVYNGTSILLGMDENRFINFIQLRLFNESSIYFRGNTTDNTLTFFSPQSLLYSAALSEGTNDAIEAVHASNLSQPHRQRTPQSQRQRRTFVYRRGDDTSEECTSFKVIPIAVAYDAEFCQLHRSSELAAEVAIQIIVAGASEIYENDMCIKLQLTSIIPDLSCSTSNSYYTSFTKSSCGGDSGYLSDFSLFMQSIRASLNIDRDSLVHLFSGATPPGEIRGCAWRPGLCSLEFGYGVTYQSANHPDPFAQSLLLAHELGHNLNAEHDVSTLSGLPNYIMEPIENDGSDGFSQVSIDAILRLIESNVTTCDTVETLPTAPPRPTAMPIDPPTSPADKPSSLPILSLPTLRPQTSRPTPRPTLKPVSPRPTSLPPTTRPQTPRPTLQPVSPRPTSLSPTARPQSPRPTLQPVSPRPTSLPLTVHPQTTRPTLTTPSPLVRPPTSSPVSPRPKPTRRTPRKPTVSPQNLQPSSQPLSPTTSRSPQTSQPLVSPKPTNRQTTGPTSADNSCNYVSNSFCVTTSGLDNDYACIPKSNLVDALPGCQSAFFIEVRGCFFEKAPDESRRRPRILRRKRRKENFGIGGTSNGTGDGRNSDRSMQFQWTSCSNSCVSVNQFVCVNVKNGGVVRIFSKVTDSSKQTMKLTSLVSIIPPSDVEKGICIRPTATCSSTV